MTTVCAYSNVSGMTNTALLPTNPNTKEATMANTITPTVARDVQMGDVVTVRGARYTVADEPIYVRRGQLYVRWALEAVPAGLRTGVITGDYDVLADDVINVG